MSPQREGGVGWRPLLVCPDARLRQETESALRSCGAFDITGLGDYPAPGIVLRTAAERESNVALIDISTDAGRAMATVAEIGTALPMIALHLNQPDASSILRLLRQGVREFVSPPMDATQLTLMLLRLIEPLARTDEKQPGTVTLVVPGKPGSGASSVAVQLAAETERNGIGPLLLLDTDSAADTVAFLLKMQPEYRLSDALRDWARMDGELWTRMVMRAGGLHVLAAPDPANPVHLDRAGAAEVLDFCRQSYPVTIIDAGGVTQDSTGHFASVADHLLMVTTPDLPALHATRRSIEWLERAGIDRQKIQLVVNQPVSRRGLGAAGRGIGAEDGRGGSLGC